MESLATAAQRRCERMEQASRLFGALNAAISATGLESGRIKQADELALIVITDFLDRERVFTLAQQQELIGPHPHDFIWRGEPAGRNVPADALRRPGAIFAPARTA